MAEYSALWHEAHGCGAKIFFADEAHFRADAKLRGKWVLRGEPALVDSSSPALWRESKLLLGGLPGDGRGGMDGAGRQQQLWNLGCLPGATERGAHRAIDRDLGQRSRHTVARRWREFLQTPGLGLQLVNLPGYSPDFNADEAVWGWAREEATGNLCLGTKALVQERVGNFLQGLSSRKDEVKRRCRTVLQSRAETLRRDIQTLSQPLTNAHPTLALV